MGVGVGVRVRVAVAVGVKLRIGVRIQDFERWLESQGRPPPEVILKGRSRERLRSEVAPEVSTGTSRGGLRNRGK